MNERRLRLRLDSVATSSTVTTHCRSPAIETASTTRNRLICACAWQSSDAPLAISKSPAPRSLKIAFNASERWTTYESTEASRTQRTRNAEFVFRRRPARAMKREQNPQLAVATTGPRSPFPRIASNARPVARSGESNRGRPRPATNQREHRREPVLQTHAGSSIRRTARTMEH